ncbi:MAG: nucleoside triphosphate pyrophosphohydrolase [Bacteroidales bacterium]|nr:nucleoside triphosphate pyrophosphohydrolase [Bacteroidales bacterium]
MTMEQNKLDAFERIGDIMDRLRTDCPWDRKQTNDTLRILTQEEVFELSDAIIKKDDAGICEELGDVLLHILFYAKIAEEKKSFTIADVCNRLCDKMIYRHPHVFGSAEADSAAEVIRTWQILKLQEGKGKTVLGGVPDSLPSLVKAYRIQDKARSAGFDWKNKEDVWDKVKEEVSEVEAEIRSKTALKEQEADPVQQQAIQERIEEEFGDLMFSIINAARLYKINPDNALERTNQKFIKRFNYLESKAKEQGKNVNELTFEEMNTLWDEAKTAL